MVARKVLAQGLGRAGADVAEHDSDRADGQLQLAIAIMPMAVMAGVGGGFEGSCGAPARLLRLSSHRAPLDEPAPLEQVSRSEEHTSEIQSLMRISYAVFCLKKKNTNKKTKSTN